MAKVRVGVIGTGFGARTVAPAFAATPGCEVVDVVTPRDDAGVRALCGRPDVDLISIHSPPFLHLEHVRYATESGHTVLCDKPFGRSADEATEMKLMADDAGVVNLLNFERRFDPVRGVLASMLRAGSIGTPEHFQYSRFTALPTPLPHGWLHSRSLGGGWIAGQGSHVIDAFRWLFGELGHVGEAVTRILQAERPDRDGVLRTCDADDGFTAVLQSAGGVTGVIDVTVGSSVSMPERMTVFGSAGVLEITGPAVVHRRADGAVDTHDVDLGGRTPLVVSMERFAAIACEAVRTGAAPLSAPTFADGVACAAAMDIMGR